MELGMREWFLVIGGLMIVGVLAHGAWLFVKSRREAIGVRYERNIPDIDVDDIDLLRGELPSGGARVVTSNAAREEIASQQAELEAAPHEEAPPPEPPPEPAPVRAARQGRARVDLDEQVPVLMDPIDQDVADAVDEVAEDRAEDVAEDVAEDAAEDLAGEAFSEPSTPDGVDVPVEADDARADDVSEGMEQAPLFAGDPIVDRGEGRETPKRARGERRGRGAKKGRGEDGDERRRKRAPREEAAAEAEAPEALGPPEDVIVINVLCRGGQQADGPTLLETITDHGLRFGDMNIFHRPSPGDRARVDFSVASAVEPGTFDLGAMDEFATPGITMFMQLPGPANPLEAFEDMVSIARGIATRIGGDLKDEQHSVMTAQTIEHCRQRIRDFARRQMSRRA